MNPTPPYAFTGPYAGCYSYAVMAMDPRHVYMIHGVLSAWPFRNGLELGSFHGASSTAFVEAINAGHGLVATFCEVRPTPSLYEVLGHCPRGGQVRLTRDHSWDVLEADDVWDFVLVDANHDAASVAKELSRLLIRRPLCVMAHDTNATAAGFPRCEGAAMLAHTFRKTPGYFCIEDCDRRNGERTERGLFLATTDAGLYAAASRVFEQYH